MKRKVKARMRKNENLHIRKIRAKVWLDQAN